MLCDMIWGDDDEDDVVYEIEVYLFKADTDHIFGRQSYGMYYSLDDAKHYVENLKEITRKQRDTLRAEYRIVKHQIR